MIEQDAMEAMAIDKNLRIKAQELFNELCKYKYSYHFEWLGRPIIQFPQDMIAVQEIIWKVKPDLIIETGVAHGGSLVYSASMLALLDQFENTLGRRKVVGIDVLIKNENKEELKKHPLFSMIDLIIGSSTDNDVIRQIEKICSTFKNVMIFLDSNHSHEHVSRELNLFSKFVSVGSYLVVFDTIVDNMPESFFKNRPWGRGDNPMTALKQFLKENDDNPWTSDQILLKAFRNYAAAPHQVRAIRELEHHINPYVLSVFANNFSLGNISDMVLSDEELRGIFEIQR